MVVGVSLEKEPRRDGIGLDAIGLACGDPSRAVEGDGVGSSLRGAWRGDENGEKQRRGAGDVMRGSHMLVEQYSRLCASCGERVEVIDQCASPSFHRENAFWADPHPAGG